MSHPSDPGPAGPSRRELLRAATIGRAGMLGACASTGDGGEGDPPDDADERELALAGYAYDRVAALAKGQVGVEGYTARFEPAGIYVLNAIEMGADQRWEVQEIGLHPYMLAFANEGLRDYTLVSVFPLRAYVEGDPRVARLFPDSRAVERADFTETGIFPIMHAVTARGDAVERDPGLPGAVSDAYSRAKARMYAANAEKGWAMVALPWFAAELESNRELMGDNYWPYGIPSNRTTLEALFRYSDEQGLASRELSIEELFHPSALELLDQA